MLPWEVMGEAGRRKGGQQVVERMAEQKKEVPSFLPGHCRRPRPGGRDE